MFNCRCMFFHNSWPVRQSLDAATMDMVGRVWNYDCKCINQLLHLLWLDIFWTEHSCSFHPPECAPAFATEKQKRSYVHVCINSGFTYVCKHKSNRLICRAVFFCCVRVQRRNIPHLLCSFSSGVVRVLRERYGITWSYSQFIFTRKVNTSEDKEGGDVWCLPCARPN